MAVQWDNGYDYRFIPCRIHNIQMHSHFGSSAFNLTTVLKSWFLKWGERKTNLVHAGKLHWSSPITHAEWLKTLLPGMFFLWHYQWCSACSNQSNAFPTIKLAHFLIWIGTPLFVNTIIGFCLWIAIKLLLTTLFTKWQLQYTFWMNLFDGVFQVQWSQQSNLPGSSVLFIHYKAFIVFQTALGNFQKSFIFNTIILLLTETVISHTVLATIVWNMNSLVTLYIKGSQMLL